LHEIQTVVAKQWLDQLCHGMRFGFPEKLENVYVFKEHFNADCFKTNSWVEIPEERFKGQINPNFDDSALAV